MSETPLLARCSAKAGTLALAATIYTGLALALARVIPPPVRTITADDILDQSAIRPEPVESALYMVALVFFPSFFVIFTRVGGYKRLEDLCARFNRASFAGSVLVAVSFCAWAASGDGFFYHRLSCLSFAPWTWALAVGSAAVAAAVPKRHGSRWHDAAAGTLVVIASLAYGAFGVFSTRDPYVGYPDGHFEAAFFSVSRVFLGEPLVSACGTQYGFYAGFLAPVFKALGLTVLGYSAVMSSISVACLVGLWSVLRRETGKPWLATGIWGAMVSFSFLSVFPYVKEQMGDGMHNDPYFQYVPIRILFPTLTLVFCSAELSASRRRRLVRIAGHIVLAFAPLWNFEMGVVSWFAWILFLGYRALSEHGITVHGLGNAFAQLLGGMLACFGAIGAFSLAHTWAYGVGPAWGALLRYQGAFYANGYSMLPMEIPQTWMIVAAVYLAGLVVSCVALVRGATREEKRAHAMVFATAVLGAGVFVYFQGRSHQWVLPAVAYPAWIVFGLLVRDSLDTRGARVIRGFVAALCVTWIMTGAMNLLEVRGEVLARLAAATKPPFTRDEEAFFDRIPRETTPLFLSFRASVLYLRVHHAPPFCPSLTELITRSDYVRLGTLLQDPAGPKNVVFEASFLQATQSDKQWQAIWRLAEKNFVVADRGPSMVRLLRK